ncbi:hypothetical protein EV183_000923 [Coemansia sp. RSA 2336]|nr:hypothetical protein EV183_000923 [Coemansia sp. RSA 2336]
MVDIDKLKQACRQIVHEGDLNALTNKVVRRSAEQKLGLDTKELDQEPYKALVKTTVEQVLKELESETQNGEEDGRASTEEPEANGDDKKSDVESAADDESESHDSDEAFSSDIDKEPAATKKKRTLAESPQKAPKRPKTVKASKASDTTIANLKSYIGKCGVRKVWSKELADMNTAQQVRHLKSMLADLGMVGRPTLEKCKKIKAKRDLQAELDAINAENILDEDEPAPRSARSRRSAAQNVSYNADHVSDSEEEAAVQESLDEDEESDFAASSKEDAPDAVEEPASEEESEYAAGSDNGKEGDAQDVAEESAFEEDSD